MPAWSGSAWRSMPKLDLGSDASPIIQSSCVSLHCMLFSGSVLNLMPVAFFPFHFLFAISTEPGKITVSLILGLSCFALSEQMGPASVRISLAMGLAKRRTGFLLFVCHRAKCATHGHNKISGIWCLDLGNLAVPKFSHPDCSKIVKQSTTSKVFQAMERCCFSNSF